MCVCVCGGGGVGGRRVSGLKLMTLMTEKTKQKRTKPPFDEFFWIRPCLAMFSYIMY